MRQLNSFASRAIFKRGQNPCSIYQVHEICRGTCAPVHPLCSCIGLFVFKKAMLKPDINLLWSEVDMKGEIDKLARTTRSPAKSLEVVLGIVRCALIALFFSHLARLANLVSFGTQAPPGGLRRPLGRRTHVRGGALPGVRRPQPQPRRAPCRARGPGMPSAGLFAP